MWTKQHSFSILKPCHFEQKWYLTVTSLTNMDGFFFPKPYITLGEWKF